MRERFSDTLKSDPYCNQNLSHIAEEFVRESRPGNPAPRRSV